MLLKIIFIGDCVDANMFVS